MSEVISFRLNRNNPREAQALEILEAWYSKGYSVRYIFTEAMLKLNDPSAELIKNSSIQELNDNLNQVNRLLEQIGNSGYSLFLKGDENPEDLTLSDTFVVSIKKGVKPGVKLD